jgi:hypothetical protein
MSEHMANINLLAIKMNGGKKSIIVTANIKHHQITTSISRRKRLPQIIKS